MSLWDQMREKVANFDFNNPNRAGRKVQGEMRYEAYDESERDIYRNPDARRTKRKDAPSKEWIYYVTTFIAAAVYVLLTALVVMILISIYKSKHPDYVVISFTKTFWSMALNPATLPQIKLFVLLATAGLTSIVYARLERNYRLQNIETDTEELNKNEGESRLLQPEEMVRNFDIFPDVGAHSSVEVSALISHFYITNDGIKEIEMGDRKSDFVDRYILKKDGVKHMKNKNNYVDEKKTLWNPYDLDPYDSDVYEELRTKKVPFIDIAFGKKNAEASGITKRTMVTYNPRKLLYNNPGKEIFGKTNELTVADKINNDWWFPDYEVQRPGGFYVVATGAINSIVVAMTRAGKGQTIIEPTLDMWTRMDEPANIVVNDPKGELLVRFSYPARKRGMEVIAFNLEDPANTNIYNPLGYAVAAARQGRYEECAEHVKNIGDIFFPPVSGQDPMWNNAANASYKRTALGMIDYYLEEEYYIRDKAVKENWSVEKLDVYLDNMWGKVTLYNVYQMMSQLSSRKSQDERLVNIVDKTAKSKDYLTLFFDATSMLPKDKLRQQVTDQDQPLRAMAQSSKTLASVQGISLTALALFSDPLIKALTSGKPSQNFDILGLGFPRRIGVHLEKNFAERKAYAKERFRWRVYEDKEFKHEIKEDELGSTFRYDGVIDPQFWIFYRTKGIFPNNIVYLKLEIFSKRTRDVMADFYFEFEKRYMLNSDETSFVIDEVTGEEIIKDGYLREMVWDKSKKEFVIGSVEDEVEEVDLLNSLYAKTKHKINVIDQSDVHYSEKTKFVDFVTPPNKLNTPVFC
ncbi:type IV secretory system conjugative DNA transfer family protein [Ligilactobacillus equi]|uniref:type IV secretory system conjugative DNA transfer family protein n=1 Tax=Ligilactobacillus equi TaxID=137357 RepID=UPI00046814A2|nr:type IV secretory system conjugative DNA transfer family protein [Ligilactobacillus equi]